MEHDVFISHADQDQEVAEKVCQELEKSDIRCWLPSRDILTGENKADAINRAIQNCEIMVFIFSSHSNQDREAANSLILAMDSDDIVIPFKVDQVIPEGALGYYLTGAHWLEAHNPPEQDDLDNLIATVKSFLSGEIEPPAPVYSPRKAAKISQKAELQAAEQKNKEEAAAQRNKSFFYNLVILFLIPFAALFYFTLDTAQLSQPDITADDVGQDFSGAEFAGRGNSLGNLVNRGYAASAGDRIFYHNSADNGFLYSSDFDGENKTLIAREPAYNINVLGDWIFFVNQHNQVSSTRTRGGEPSMIMEGGVEYLSAVDGWLYFVSHNHRERIVKTRPDGSERSRVNDESSAYLNVVGDWIYYVNRDHFHSIYKIRNDGSEQQLVVDDDARFLNVIDDWIYYISSRDRDRIYKVNTDGSNRTNVNSDQSRFLNSDGEWLYYVNLDDGGRIYRIGLDGDNKSRLNYEFSGSINIAGGWIFYENLDGGGYLHKMRLDGSENQHMQ